MFMTESELHHLTGYKIPSKQMKQLSKMGLKYLIGCDGKPRVSKLAVHNVLEGRAQSRKSSPDFEALRSF